MSPNIKPLQVIAFYGIFCVAGPVAWNSLPLFGTYIINFLEHTQDTFSHVPTLLAVSRV